MTDPYLEGLVMLRFDFPVGYEHLHRIKIIDFQLNRWYSWGYVSLSEMREAAHCIAGLDDFKGEIVRLAERAEKEGRILNATFLYRAAEFFTRPSDPDKVSLYDRFSHLFYSHLTINEPMVHHQVPYGDTFLPALKLPSQREEVRAAILIHGGFDSFVEEFYAIGCHFAQKGYDVILFEGPGQGAALKKYGVYFDYRWEFPTAAVLDFFGLDEATLIGYSMGGWYCFRTAAFEPRIKRVIASSVAYDYMKALPGWLEKMIRWMIQYPDFINQTAMWKMKLMPQERWSIDQMMYITGQGTPYEAMIRALELNEGNLASQRVTQEVLILSGEADHFIPLKLHHLQVAALSRAKSVTERIFTRRDQAHNHCQVGNTGLALRVMSDWLEERGGSVHCRR